MTPRCVTCQFFDAYPHAATAPDATGGVCHRHAPQATPHDPMHSDWSAIHARWPHVRGTDWCGEYQERVVTDGVR